MRKVLMVVDKASDPLPFSQAAFERWALATHDKSPDSVRYYLSRLRAMLRLGLDVDAFLASPQGGHDQAEQLVSRVKALPRYSAHVHRNYARVLNWLCAYAEHLDAGKRTWKRRPLPKEPRAVPKTVETPDLSVLWTYQGPDPYTTLLRRAIAEVALAGNFRRRELGTLRLRHLKPETGQIELVRAGKGSVSGLVEVPWTLYWPESALLQYLAVRAPVKQSDALWTTQFGGGRPLSPASVYGHLKAMGEELGIPLSFIRTKRRALTDADRQIRDLRITQAKSRHVKVDNLMTYLGRIDGPTVRTALAAAEVPGYGPEARGRAARNLPSPQRDGSNPLAGRDDEHVDANGLGTLDQSSLHADAPVLDDGSKTLVFPNPGEASVAMVPRASPLPTVFADVQARAAAPMLEDGHLNVFLVVDKSPKGIAAIDIEGRKPIGAGRSVAATPQRAGDKGQDAQMAPHAARRPRGLFPLSSPSPAQGAKEGSPVASEAGVVAPADPAPLSTLPGLSPPSGGRVDARANSPANPVDAGKDGDFFPKEHVRMEQPTLVSKAGRLDRPSALVAARPLPTPELALVLTEKKVAREALTNASPAAAQHGGGRPRTGVDAPAQELPRHGIPPQGDPEHQADLGAFTRIGVVAPSGSSQAGTPSRYPATRPALRHEVSAAARNGGC